MCVGGGAGCTESSRLFPGFVRATPRLQPSPLLSSCLWRPCLSFSEVPSPSPQRPHSSRLPSPPSTTIPICLPSTPYSCSGGCQYHFDPVPAPLCAPPTPRHPTSTRPPPPPSSRTAAGRTCSGTGTPCRTRRDQGNGPPGTGSQTCTLSLCLCAASSSPCEQPRKSEFSALGQYICK